MNLPDEAKVGLADLSYPLNSDKLTINKRKVTVRTNKILFL